MAGAAGPASTALLNGEGAGGGGRSTALANGTRTGRSCSAALCAGVRPSQSSTHCRAAARRPGERRGGGSPLESSSSSSWGSADAPRPAASGASPSPNACTRPVRALMANHPCSGESAALPAVAETDALRPSVSLEAASPASAVRSTVFGVVVCALAATGVEALPMAGVEGLGEAVRAAPKRELNASLDLSRFICRSRSALRASRDRASSPPLAPLPSAPASSPVVEPDAQSSPAASSCEASRSSSPSTCSRLA